MQGEMTLLQDIRSTECQETEGGGLRPRSGGSSGRWAGCARGRTVGGQAVRRFDSQTVRRSDRQTEQPTPNFQPARGAESVVGRTDLKPEI